MHIEAQPLQPVAKYSSSVPLRGRFGGLKPCVWAVQSDGLESSSALSSWGSTAHVVASRPRGTSDSPPGRHRPGLGCAGPSPTACCGGGGVDVRVALQGGGLVPEGGGVWGGGGAVGGGGKRDGGKGSGVRGALVCARPGGCDGPVSATGPGAGVVRTVQGTGSGCTAWQVCTG